MSNRPGAHEVTAGAEPSCPPRLSHPDQRVPVYHRCHRASSVPRAKTSIRPGDGDVTEGCDAMSPPRFRLRVQEPPAGRYTWRRSPAVDRVKTSDRPAVGDVMAAEPVSVGGTAIVGATAAPEAEGAVVSAPAASGDGAPTQTVARRAATQSTPRRVIRCSLGPLRPVRQGRRSLLRRRGPP